MKRRLCQFNVLLFASCFLAGQARGSFHLWRINEIYSNADGSVQFVEFFLSPTIFDQRFLVSQTLSCVNVSGTVTNRFTFPASLPAAATSGFFLVATPGFASLPGAVTPDYTIPTSFLFLTSGRLNFADVDIVTYTNLPTDGVQSLTRNNTLNAVNSPVNFARQTGSVMLANSPPMVTLTNPPPNSVFPAPATVTLGASATDSDGSVTNVDFLAGPTLLGSKSVSPFVLTVSNLAAGSYSLTAQATDNRGAKGTSGPVIITVVVPDPIILTPPIVTNDEIVLTYSATPGLTYFLERTTDFPPTWTHDSTNLATSSSITVRRPVSPGIRRLYWRVELSIR